MILEKKLAASSPTVDLILLHNDCMFVKFQLQNVKFYRLLSKNYVFQMNFENLGMQCHSTYVVVNFY